jgi:DNA repair ATPase RecN
VLVFLPIVLAWLSIRQVTSSYRRYSARNPEQAVDFLSFWSNPSRGIEQLQTVALLIAVIVAAVIAITVFLGSLEASAQARVAEEQLRRERERANIIVKLRLVLTPRRKVDVQSVEASLTAAIEDFRYSSNQLRESTAQLHEIFESTESLGPQLERSTQKMNEIISMMQKDLSGSILGLTSQVQSLGSELTGIDSKLGRSLEERIENVVNMTSGLTRNFDVLAGRLDQVCRAAEASAARLAAMTGAPSFSPQNDE